MVFELSEDGACEDSLVYASGYEWSYSVGVCLAFAVRVPDKCRAMTSSCAMLVWKSYIASD